jgi:hypothetical protein
MERIVIEVNKATAKKWRASSKPKRKEIVTLLNEALNERTTLVVEEPVLGYARPIERESERHFKDVQKRLPSYKAFLEGIREKAKTNGLTEEILEAILKKGA